MADKKISELNSADLPLSGDEQLAIVQSGETKKVNASDIGGGGGESLWERSTGANSLIPKDSGSVASGDNSIAEGFNTQAKAPYSRTGGRSTIVETNAEGGIAEGEDTITRGKGARSGGLESEANGDSSVADGDNVIAQSYAETVVGLYNELDASFNPTSSTPTDKAFSVGVGQFGDEKNGLVVRKNGIVTADELTQAQYDAEPTGKVLVTKEILNDALPNTDDFVEKAGDTMTGLLQTPVVREEMNPVPQAGISGTYNIDWSLYSTQTLKLTGNTILTESNIPTAGYEQTIIVYIEGDFALTLPGTWIVVGGTYDPAGTQFIVQSWDDGNFYCAIGGGEIDLSNYLQKSGGTMSGSLTVASENYVQIQVDQTDSCAITMAVPSSTTKGAIYVTNTGSNHLQLPTEFEINLGSNAVFEAKENGNVRLITTPIFADNTDASSLETGTIYRTSAGDLKIKY